MVAQALPPRHVRALLESALNSAPLVLLQGMSGCGKSTLARQVAPAAGLECTWEDAELAEPAKWARGIPDTAVLEELHRSPGRLVALAKEAKRRKYDVRWLLTSSIRLFELDDLPPAFRKRCELVRLDPYGAGELGRTGPSFVERLLQGEPTWPQPGASIGDADAVEELALCIVRGGLPQAVARPRDEGRQRWHMEHVQELLEAELGRFPRLRQKGLFGDLLRGAAQQCGRAFSLRDLCAPFDASRSTVSKYLSILEQLLLLERTPGVEQRSPSELHFADTGLACALLDLDVERLLAEPQRLAQLGRTHLLRELQNQASALATEVTVVPHRARGKDEANGLLLARGDEVFAVQLALDPGCESSALRALGEMREAAGAQFRRGVVLRDRETISEHEGDTWGLPLRQLWAGSPEVATARP